MGRQIGIDRLTDGSRGLLVTQVHIQPPAHQLTLRKSAFRCCTSCEGSLSPRSSSACPSSTRGGTTSLRRDCSAATQASASRYVTCACSSTISRSTSGVQAGCRQYGAAVRTMSSILLPLAAADRISSAQMTQRRRQSICHVAAGSREGNKGQSAGRRELTVVRP